MQQDDAVGDRMRGSLRHDKPDSYRDQVGDGAAQNVGLHYMPMNKSCTIRLLSTLRAQTGVRGFF